MKLNLRYKQAELGSIFIFILFGFILFWSAYSLSKNFLEDKVYNLLINVTVSNNPSKNITVIAIDDESISKIGRWSWKRTNYADMFEYIENYGNAKVIAFDSIISSYGDKKDDAEFFSRLSKLNTVVSGVFFGKQKGFISSNEQEKIFKEKYSLNVKDERSEKLIQNSEYFNNGYVLKEIADSMPVLGSVLSNPDKDGFIKKLEPVFYYKNAYYPSLGLAVANKLYPHDYYKLYENYFMSDDYRINPVSIPLFSNDQGSYCYIKWHKSPDKTNIYPYKTISAWKILESFENIKKKKSPIVAKEDLKNKIIVIGVTATALKDIKPTPMGADYPGVYVQATIIDNFLNNQFMRIPHKFVDWSMILLFVLLSFIISLLLPILYSSILSIILALSYFSLCLFIAYPKNYALDAVTPIILIFCGMLISYGFKYFIVDRKKREIKSLIAKYVSKDILNVILSDEESSKLGGKRADVSILFADIRNFTAISDILEPEQISAMLNEYFGEMIPITYKYDGTVNKFIGDALLIIFGAPVENVEHAQKSVRCAVEMMEKVNELQQKWQAENKPVIDIGIGISSGIAFVGNIGSDERHEYSAIGNTVNTANRLESFNKLYKTNILISENTYEKVKDIIEANEVDCVCITQNADPIKIYEVKSLTK